MDLQVSPATHDDIARIVEIQFSAFEGDPYQEALYPGDDYYSPALRSSAAERTLGMWKADPSGRWMKCTDARTGTILGFALWNVYDWERDEKEWKQRPTVDWCEGRKKEIAENFLYMNCRLREKIWGGKPYLLLNLLCIHQDSQRHGAGTLLVQEGLALAKSKGLSAYLEASPMGFHLYQKLGFHQVDVGIVKAAEYDGDQDRKYIAMIKDPEDSSKLPVKGQIAADA